MLSDGAEVAFDLQKTGVRQIIPLGKHTVRWMRLERMQKSDDPSAFPALTEWEVYGCDKEGEQDGSKSVLAANNAENR